MSVRNVLWVLAALLFAGCGEDESAVRVGGWHHVEVHGLANASGITLLDDTLFICCGNGTRRLFAVPAVQLVHGGRVSAREIPVDVRADREVIGYDDIIAQRGFTLDDLWNADLDLQGIAAQDPELLFVGDRAHRIVFWGRVEREVGGRFARFRVEHGVIPPGAKRTNTDVADYRDQGPGISGLCGVRDPRTEDLVLVERANGGSGDPANEFRVLLLDRFGGLGRSGFFVVRVPDGPPLVEGVSWINDAYTFVRGDGRGAIASVESPGLMRRTDIGEPTPGPEIPDAGDWRGMVHGPDGTLYLVSGGSPGVIAWRRR